jgi:LSD1 subclass zinc finger protein
MILFYVALSGEEITENYYPYYSHMPRKERIPWLYDHYRFTCTCVACNGHYPIRRDLKENHFYLRCQQCRTPLKALHDKSEIRCTKCNHIEGKSDHIWVRVHDLEKEIEASQHLFHRDLDESNLKELLVVTSKRCGELSSYLCAPTKMLQDALEWNSALNRRLKCSRRTRQE